MAAHQDGRKSRTAGHRPVDMAHGISPRHDARPSQPSPIAGEPDANAALGLLLNVERQARQCANVAELQHLIANETRKLNRARQIFVAELGGSRGVEISAISAVSAVDRSSMLVAGLHRLLERLGRVRTLSQPVEFTLPAFCDPDSDLATAYPFREMAWVPFLDRTGAPFAGMLLARETVWTADDLSISRRLGEVFEHAWRELRPSARPLWTIARRWKIAFAAASLLSLAIPVPMTALAPVEIVALDAAIAAAPIDGVIETIDVDPGARVRAGDVLFQFSDTTPRNRRDIAAREVVVAQARVKQQTLIAFGDARGRHELGIAEADLNLKRAEFTFADELLGRTVVRAPRDGVAIYADRKSLIGRPVSTGERIMEIADPGRIESRIDVAMTDVIALKGGGRVKLFLDVDPLRPWSGRISRSDYRARPSDTDVLSLRAFAALDRDERPEPRIGLRGTAQIYGDLVPLGIAIFRRPLSAARQWMGI